MMHARPEIKIHPAHAGAIPTFAKSHPPVDATTPHTPAAAPAPAQPFITTEISHGDIAERAYDIYSRSGYRQGQCQQNWEQAENDLRQSGATACHKEHIRNEVFAPDSIAPQ